jgi:hypothetical protein
MWRHKAGRGSTGLQRTRQRPSCGRHPGSRIGRRYIWAISPPELPSPWHPALLDRHPNYIIEYNDDATAEPLAQ